MNQGARVLFHELADLSSAERERVYSERRIEPDVCAEVESLLRFDIASEQGLTDCVSGTAGEMLRTVAGQQPIHCGPYRLVQLLGSGGMGAVYLGQRSDGEIQQKVAVKLLDYGGYDPTRRDRFLKERQLLASLNHPSIVRVFDAGHTEDGRPYLVMEFVEGVPIDVYAARLGVRDRLTLLLRVCEGVSHAHRHLIIHRDLKPSNILVDASGQPKLLDFGIAKLLDETGDPTRTIDRLLTPNYASPEQLRGGAQTTATDIYSLGAVLYKLLTSRSPHESGTGTSQAFEVLTGARPIPLPSRLNPDLSADIDFILRKALRQEPEERYASVDAFADDVYAFLDSRPVQARSGDAWYRTRKLVRRYWVSVVLGSLVIASLSAGLYMANRGRVIAEQRFSQLRQLSNKVFDLDTVIRNLPGSTQARRNLVSASLGYLESLAHDTHGDLDLAQEISNGYWRAARIQGVPNELNLGQSAEAEASLKKADSLIETVLSSRPRSRSALLLSARIANDRMILAQSENRRADALSHMVKVGERLDLFLRQGEPSEFDRTNAAAIYANIALSYLNMHMYANSIPFAQRCVDLARRIPSAQYRVAEGLSLLASAQRYQGDLAAALQSIREARAAAQGATYSSETHRMIDLYGVLLREGLILGEDGGVNLNRPAEAIDVLQRAFDLSEEAARKDPSDATSRGHVGTSGRELGNILRHQHPERALAVYGLAIRRLSEIPDSLRARRDKASVLAASSYPLSRLHRPAEAKQRIDASLATLQATRDYPATQVRLDGAVYIALRASADYEAGQGDPHRAVNSYRQLLEKVMAAKPEPLTDLRDAARLSLLYAALARADRRVGDPSAEDMESRRLELWRHWDRKLPHNSFIRSQLAAARIP
jgi:serine/threonine protein kinase